MVQAAYSSISGVLAAFNLQSASAHNVANGNTDGFKGAVARAEEAYQGGVKVTLSQDRNPVGSDELEDGQELDTSNVEYSKEAVNQIGSKHLLSANLAVLKAVDEMTGSVIDMFA